MVFSLNRMELAEVAMVGSHIARHFRCTTSTAGPSKDTSDLAANRLSMALGTTTNDFSERAETAGLRI